jgi:hypothetical protein
VFGMFIIPTAIKIAEYKMKSAINKKYVIILV